VSRSDAGQTRARVWARGAGISAGLGDRLQPGLAWYNADMRRATSLQPLAGDLPRTHRDGRPCSCQGAEYQSDTDQPDSGRLGSDR